MRTLLRTGFAALSLAQLFLACIGLLMVVVLSAQASQW